MLSHMLNDRAAIESLKRGSRRGATRKKVVKLPNWCLQSVTSVNTSEQSVVNLNALFVQPPYAQGGNAPWLN